MALVLITGASGLLGTDAPAAKRVFGSARPCTGVPLTSPCKALYVAQPSRMGVNDARVGGSDRRSPGRGSMAILRICAQAAPNESRG
jgi:hypothetical protein